MAEILVLHAAHIGGSAIRPHQEDGVGLLLARLKPEFRLGFRACHGPSYHGFEFCQAVLWIVIEGQLLLAPRRLYGTARYNVSPGFRILLNRAPTMLGVIRHLKCLDILVDNSRCV
jgi:hypothetical protein